MRALVIGASVLMAIFFAMIFLVAGISFKGQAAEASGEGLARGGILPWPIRGVVSSPFGIRLRPEVGEGEELHEGLDLAAAEGTSVHASSAGVVTAAGWSGNYGLLVELTGPDMVTRYGHLLMLEVAVGDSVEAGQVIGYVGSTGRSTGPHLHFEVRPRGGLPVDPLPYLEGADGRPPLAHTRISLASSLFVALSLSPLVPLAAAVDLHDLSVSQIESFEERTGLRRGPLAGFSEGVATLAPPLSEREWDGRHVEEDRVIGQAVR